MSVGAQMVVVLKAFVEHCVSLVLGHPFEFSWLDVSQTDVFHCSSPLGGRQLLKLTRWIVHPIVVAHRENRQGATPGANVYRLPVGTAPARSEFTIITPFEVTV